MTQIIPPTPAHKAATDPLEQAASDVAYRFSLRGEDANYCLYQDILSELRKAAALGAGQSLAERVRVEGLASVLYEAHEQTDDVFIRHHVRLAAGRAHFLEGAKS